MNYWPWEYAIAPLSNENTAQQSHIINSLGRDGWELVAIVALNRFTVNAYFKRPKQVSEKPSV